MLRSAPCRKIYFLGFTLYCTRNLKGNFRIGMRTERSRLQRTLMRLQDLMRRMRHLPVKEQVDNLNVLLRGHYAYFGIAGNFRALQKVYRAVERYWHKMLCSRSWKGRIRWTVFNRAQERTNSVSACPSGNSTRMGVSCAKDCSPG